MVKSAEDMFRPEFLNRIDEVIVFRKLMREHILEIEDIYLADINRRLADRHIELELTEAAKEFLCDKGFNADTGARTLRRAVERHLEDPLAEEMLKGNVTDDSLVTVDVDSKEEKLVFKPRERETKAKAEKA